MSARLERALAELADAIREEVAAVATVAGPRPDRLLSIEEAGQVLGISRTLVYDELRAGRLASVKVGRRRLIPSSALTAYAPSPR